MDSSPLLTRPGAVPGPDGDPDAAVPAHLGEPLREQVALADGRAVTHLARDVVTVSGPDRLSWLTTLSSQAFTGLTSSTLGGAAPGAAPGAGSAETLLMDAQGHLTHALAVSDDGERTWLVTEADDGETLAGFLDSMRFTLRVEVAAAPDVAVLGAHGPGLAALVAAVAAGVPEDSPERTVPVTWRDPWPGVVEGGTSYFLGAEHPGAAYAAGHVLVPAEDVDAVVDAFLAGGPDRLLAGSLAWEALRVEAGRPRWAREVDERTIAHELDWLRTAVHLTKGCYPGQETIARVVNLGRPPRRLTILQLDGSGGDLPLPGATVRLGEKAVGAVTTVARHHELGPVALAVLRRAVPVEAALTVDVAGEQRVAAAQEPLVGPEGRSQASPAQRPGAGLGRSLLR